MESDYNSMIGTRPDGAKPGCPSKTNLNKQAQLLEEAQNKYKMAYCLPPSGSVSLEEFGSFGVGRRWLPKRDDILYAAIKKAYSIKDTVTPEGQNLSENQSSHLLRVRLCIYLLSVKKNVLVFPKPNYEFSLVYILYCCAVVDPNNMIGWREDVIKCNTTSMSAYYNPIYLRRSAAIDRMPSLGLDLESPCFLNSCIDLHRISGAWHRYRFQHKLGKGDQAYCQRQSDRLGRLIDQILETVSRKAFAVYKVSGGDLNEQRHKNVVTQHVMYVYFFDPFYSEYTAELYKCICGDMDTTSFAVLDTYCVSYINMRCQYHDLYSLRTQPTEGGIDEAIQKLSSPTTKGVSQLISMAEMRPKKVSVADRVSKMTLSELAQLLIKDKLTLTLVDKKAIKSRYAALKEKKKTTNVQDRSKFNCDPLMLTGSVLSKRANPLEGGMSGGSANKKSPIPQRPAGQK
jgi:hypothetical protein